MDRDNNDNDDKLIMCSLTVFTQNGKSDVMHCGWQVVPRGCTPATILSSALVMVLAFYSSTGKEVRVTIANHQKARRERCR